MLFDIRTMTWSDELLNVFGIPRKMLPEVVPSSGVHAMTSDVVLPAEIPIAGIAGDQHAALFGQMCTRPGMGKNTYGTGRSEEHTSELQSRGHLVCRRLLEKKKHEINDTC